MSKLKQENRIDRSVKRNAQKDLRKAVGINDRFLFINELGGWKICMNAVLRPSIVLIFMRKQNTGISRELKLKLGWNNEQPSVQHLISWLRGVFPE